MLCSNDEQRLRASIESLSELTRSQQFEIIVMDNVSNDGSQEILQDLLGHGLVTNVIEQKCTRGMGRQLALESSQGDYILCHLDCDDIFRASGIDSLIRLYHEKYEGMMMMTRRRRGGFSNITIAPRDLVFRLGGWRNINWIEDWDLWERAEAMGRYVNHPYPLIQTHHMNS